MKNFKTFSLIFILTITFTSQLYAKTSLYRLSWRDNPATTMVIGWTQKNGINPKVYYGLVDYGADYSKYKLSLKYNHKTKYGKLNNRFARLSNLLPNTIYYFVIKDSNSLSARYWFKTASDKPQPFTFIAGGDSRNNKLERKKGNRLVAKLRPLFILFGGDYTDEGTDKQWDEWLKQWQLTISDDGRIYPIIATHGNHENSDMSMVHKLFDTPHPDNYYSYNIGGDLLHISLLNSELEGNEEKWNAQNSWLVKDLLSSFNSRWKIASYHRPMRPHTSAKSEGLERIKSWAQIFYDNGVDLVVESDTHMVKRTYPLKPSEQEGSYESFIRDDKNGTVFIGEGSWGAPKRKADDDKPWTMASGSFYQFKLIHLYLDKIESRVVKFKNIRNVIALTEDTLFDIPPNIQLWNPDSGKVLTILPNGK